MQAAHFVGSLECSNHGKCNADGKLCTCEGASRSNNVKCACYGGYVAGQDGECYSPKCPFPLDKCANCQDGRCLSCIAGYTTTDFNCQTYNEGCTSGTYNGCLTCKANYQKVNNACVPKRVCTTEEMEHCSVCENGVCTKCMAGFSGSATGCTTPCDTGIKACLTCSDTDATKCVECQVGLAPACLPYVSCPYGKIATLDGACNPTECVSLDYNYGNGIYGPTFYANVTCGGFGTCSTTSQPAACTCFEGSNRDPAFKCTSCLSGYALQDGKCVRATVACAANCFSCDISGTCLTCIPGFTGKTTGCTTPCQESGCAYCDEKDPSICLTCRDTYNATSNTLAKLVCNPYCPSGCASGTFCSRHRNGTSLCAELNCRQYVDSMYVVCNYHGDCVNAKCKCDVLASGDASCQNCISGSARNPADGQCAVKLSGCPDCTSDQACAPIKGVLRCYPKACVSGFEVFSKICNSAGNCVLGVCECTDPNADPASKCVSCRKGYELSSDGVCVVLNCKAGNGLVRYCEACSATETYRCIKCSTGLAPSTDGTQCIACPADMKPSPSGDSCACADDSKAPNSNDVCAPKDCLSIANCVTCYAGDPSKCGKCLSGVPKDGRTRCESCPGNMVLSADSSFCTCPVGQQVAGDNPTKCIVAACVTSASHCEACKSDAPSICTSCKPTFKLQADGTCVCPDQEQITTAGTCAPAPCKVGEGMIQHCAACLAEDTTKCGICTGGYVPNARGDACGCAFGFELTPANECVFPSCKVDTTKIDYCSSCLPSDSKLCASCTNSRVPSADNKKCICPSPEEEADDKSCVNPACKQGSGLVYGCIQCKGSSPNLCAKCAGSLTLDSSGTKCNGCDADKVPNIEGECVCRAGEELSVDDKCVAPTCKNSGGVAHCTACQTSNPALCGKCETGRRVSGDGKTCACDSSNEEGDTGDCINPVCKTSGKITGCETCLTSDPAKCAKCETDMAPSADKTKCECVPGKEFASDGKTCVQPFCSEGSKRIEYCNNCTAADANLCAACSHSHIISNGGRECACPAGQEEDSESNCNVPLCMRDATAITACLQCSAADPKMCSKCDKKLMVIDGGARCGCTPDFDVSETEGCVPHNCTFGSTAVANCVSCAGDINKCGVCIEGYLLDSARNSCVRQKKPLSGGAIAGISIVVVIVIVAVGCGVGYFIYRKKHAFEATN